MLIKRTLLPFVAAFFGFAISPSYSGDIISCDSFENCADGSVPVTNTLLALDARMSALEAENTALKKLLAGVSREKDPNTDQDTLTFTAMNVQLVSGSGTTDGAKNGTGNLIIGYNEKRGSGDDRTGSHMLVIGTENNYSSYGGMVVGNINAASGHFASVSGGLGNTASGHFASVSGGRSNIASGNTAWVGGGYSNTASEAWSSVSGGHTNIASGYHSSVSGGQNRTATGQYDWVAGGLFQTN